MEMRKEYWNYGKQYNTKGNLTVRIGSGGGVGCTKETQQGNADK